MYNPASSRVQNGAQKLYSYSAAAAAAGFNLVRSNTNAPRGKLRCKDNVTKLNSFLRVREKGFQRRAAEEMKSQQLLANECVTLHLKTLWQIFFCYQESKHRGFQSASEIYRPCSRSWSAKLVPTFRQRGFALSAQRFLRSSRYFVRAHYFSFKQLLKYPHEAEQIPFQSYCSSENLVSPGIELGTSICKEKLWALDHTADPFSLHQLHRSL
jgi:hypothetical protein